jgi:hypothetical protein
MGKPLVLFARLYRAALLGYLLNSSEQQRARAYDLGRSAIAEGFSLLDILRTHYRAVNALLEATPDARRGLVRLKAAEDFLLEALSPFEMACRGYVELLPDRPDRVPARERRRRTRRRRTVGAFPATARDITR